MGINAFITTARSLLGVFLTCLGWRKKTDADFSGLMNAAKSAGLIDTRAAAMMEGAAQVGETRVRDIMIPRSQMVVLDKGSAWREALKTIIENGHSRYPVMDEGTRVTGILLSKDVLGCFHENGSDGEKLGESVTIQDLVRPAVFIPESKRLSTLLEEFKKSRNHMAIIVDEYGGVSGLITIEDVVEQIVGDIADEHDTEASEFIRYHEEQWLVSGATPLDDFNKHFASHIKGRDGTIAGFVIRCMGRLPRKGDSIEAHDLVFTVTRADSRRIHQLSVVTKCAKE